MTIRPGQPSRKSPISAGVAKSSAEGMDVVMMNDFEQRHLNTKSRSHSPFGHIGSPTTPLNFEQLFLQGQIPLSSELSHHEQAMLQAQLLNGMRASGMAPKPKQPPQPSLAMLDPFRQAYHRSEQEQAFHRESHEQAEWNARIFSAQQQHQQHSSDASIEPTPIALLQQKFAQIERHKAEMQQKSAAAAAAAQPPQQVQIYPSQWPMSVPNSMPPPPPPVSSAAAAAYTDSRHYVPTSAAGFYSFQQPLGSQQHAVSHQQQQQHASQVMGPPHSISEVPEQFYGVKQEMSWRPTQDSRPQWNAAPSNTDIPSNAPPLMYMTQQGQQQFQSPKVVEYQQAALQQHHHRVPEFAVPPPPPQSQQASFNSFQLNAPPPDMGLLGSVVVSSRCDKTGGHSVEIKSVNDHYSSSSRSDDSEMSLDNFSGRLGGHVAQQPQVSSVANASQIQFSNSFHMLPQSSKSAFSTFTRPSSNLNPAAASTTTTLTTIEAVVTKSLLFNDTYRRSQELSDLMHDDVDTELHL